MGSSDESRTPPEGVDSEKALGTQVETIHTNERIPGHPNYYEKGGLRTYGDDADHDHEPPVCSTFESLKLRHERDGGLMN